MSINKQDDEKMVVFPKRSFLLTFLGIILIILIMLVTQEIGHRNISTFVSSQQKYIIAIEAAILAIFIVEMLGILVRFLVPAQHMIEQGSRLRLIVRIVGYTIALASIVSILASNPTLGISVGAVAGVVIAFATQNILGSVIATLLILSTRMVRVGEEITVGQTGGQTTGRVSDIKLTHTVLSANENVVFVPNSLIVSSIVQRKRRNFNKSTNTNDW
jgi:small-conductance mechanosensitive channel